MSVWLYYPDMSELDGGQGNRPEVQQSTSLVGFETEMAANLHYLGLRPYIHSLYQDYAESKTSDVALEYAKLFVVNPGHDIETRLENIQPFLIGILLGQEVAKSAIEHHHLTFNDEMLAGHLDSLKEDVESSTDLTERYRSESDTRYFASDNASLYKDFLRGVAADAQFTDVAEADLHYGFGLVIEAAIGTLKTERVRFIDEAKPYLEPYREPDSTPSYKWRVLWGDVVKQMLPPEQKN